MKKYNFCNQCGRALQYENDILREDILAVKKDWGFFSKKDLQVHSIVCNSCGSGGKDDGDGLEGGFVC